MKSYTPYEQGINTAEHVISRHGNKKPNGQGVIRVRLAGPTYHPSTIEWGAWHCGFRYRLRRRNERAKSRIIAEVVTSPEQEPDPRSAIGVACRSWGGDMRSGNVSADGDMVSVRVWINTPRDMRNPKPDEIDPGACIRLTPDDARRMAHAIIDVLTTRQLRIIEETAHAR